MLLKILAGFSSVLQKLVMLAVWESSPLIQLTFQRFSCI